MKLIERSEYLALLQQQFEKVTAGDGHTLFVSGEAGIGKTSLINAFCKQPENNYLLFQGACDSLFTPRPLAPLFDIAWQIGNGLPAIADSTETTGDRATLFSRVLHELSNQSRPIILLFEDIHWADEATLDFIKFLARRITRIRCLFILTYRDNEIHSHHPLKTVFGQLPPDSFTRLQLPPLSKKAVDEMAKERGYNGEDVYSISGGIPFYVTEILASYSPGIPANIVDAVLTVYSRQKPNTKDVWELLSVTPAGLEIENLAKAEPLYPEAIDKCLEAKIILLDKGIIYFKHELYRRTIETSMSPFKRIALNKRILDVLLGMPDPKQQIVRIIHHAKNANDYTAVQKYAPEAARQASFVGAHIESAKLYFTAIEYNRDNNKDALIELYESYAYECYLTNKLNDAIIYQEKALEIHKQKTDREKTGNGLRFLSRLWWFNGNREHAERYALDSVTALQDSPVSRVKAMAYSNMAQLKMLSDQFEECLQWGNQAIAMSKELGADEILSHALNNVGTVQLRIESLYPKAMAMLQQSLDIALKNGYHEHAARAYTNIGSGQVCVRNYKTAAEALATGVAYCEERDLDLWAKYMSSWQAKLNLDTGQWTEANRIAQNLLQNEGLPPTSKLNALVVAATISLRRGDEDALPALIDLKNKAFETREHQRIIPAMTAFLEYEWIYGKEIFSDQQLEAAIKIAEATDNIVQNSEFFFWLNKVTARQLNIPKLFEGYDFSSTNAINKAVSIWRRIGCPYEEALALSYGNGENKKQAIVIMQQLGADAVYKKIKQIMIQAGVKNIPRGMQPTTKSNPSFLTNRELDILRLLQEGLQNKEIASRLFISAKTVDHHISSLFFKLGVNTRVKAVQEAIRLEILK